MLVEVKQYLRIDHVYEDDLLTALIDAAKSFIVSGTGVKVETTNAKSMLVLKFLVAHWYENRQLVGQSTELPYSITALLLQLETEREGIHETD